MKQVRERKRYGVLRERKILQLKKYIYAAEKRKSYNEYVEKPILEGKTKKNMLLNKNL